MQWRRTRNATDSLRSLATQKSIIQSGLADNNKTITKKKKPVEEPHRIGHNLNGKLINGITIYGRGDAEMRWVFLVYLFQVSEREAVRSDKYTTRSMNRKMDAHGKLWELTDLMSGATNNNNKRERLHNKFWHQVLDARYGVEPFSMSVYFVYMYDGKWTCNLFQFILDEWWTMATCVDMTEFCESIPIHIQFALENLLQCALKTNKFIFDHLVEQ